MNSRVVAFGACAVLAVVGAAFAADDKADAEKVLKALNGTWTFESHLLGSQKAPAELLKAATITFEGDKFTVKADGKVLQAGTHKIDVSKKPFTVDAAVAEGDGKGTTMLGIFEVDGDAMKVCFDVEGKKRPEKYESPEKSTLALMTMKRAKK